MPRPARSHQSTRRSHRSAGRRFLPTKGVRESAPPPLRLCPSAHGEGLFAVRIAVVPVGDDPPIEANHVHEVCISHEAIRFGFSSFSSRR